MLYAIVIVVGLLVGGVLGESWFAAITGALFGVLFVRSARTGSQLRALKVELEDLKTAPPSTAEAPPPAQAPVPIEPMVAPADEPEEPPVEAEDSRPTEPALDAEPDPAPAPYVPPAEDRLSDRLVEAFREARAYLIGVNTVVQVGVLILLVGIGLLGKWAADNAYFPIEARLALAVALGVTLVAVGWRTRITRFGFGVSLQGGGVGIIYLVTFFAFRTYELIQSGPAFVALVVLTAASVVLALLQNAKPLAVLGAIGGFMAPVVASSGEGSHVALFSYFALLNAGIVTVAWFKAWRELNLVGFTFTFAIGGLWGVGNYGPEKYATTQAFLILFVLMFTAIPVLYAWRQAPKLRGLLDGSLVFGVPILGFAYQARIVEDFEYGLALSSIALAGLYVALATTLYRLAPAWTRALVEAFIALGLGFATMTIPFALDAEWTALGWSLEGVGLVWIGLRQRRRLPRFSGMLLQLAAAFAIPFQAGATVSIPVLNAEFFASFSIAISGIGVAYLLHRAKAQLHRAEALLSTLFLIWGALWWYGNLLDEALRYVDFPQMWIVSLSIFAASAVAADTLARRATWRGMLVPSFILVPLCFIHMLAMADRFAAPSAHWGWLVWPSVFASAIWMLRETDLVSAGLRIGWHAMLLSLAAWVLSWESLSQIDALVFASKAWPIALHVWSIAALIFFASRFRDSPVLRAAYGVYGPLPVLFYMAFWIVLANATSSGDAYPLTTFPLLNPFDITQALVLLTLSLYVVGTRREIAPSKSRAGAYAVAALTFYALSATLVRAIHHATGVRYAFTALWNSVVVQTGLSIFWTLIALAAMVYATRRGRRPVWLVAAGLLGVVVLKLFVVDLSSLDTIARIVSFLVVGILMLFVGYLSPVPPAQETKT